MKLRHTLLLLTLALFACNDNKSSETGIDITTISTDTLQVENATEKAEMPNEYSNERFRNVVLEKLGDDKFRVKGQAQVYEATINWSVEDGHNIITDGFTTATIGAPEWGDFDFTFEAKKAEENSVLTLVLFETSAEDGSQKHSLPISLQ